MRPWLTAVNRLASSGGTCRQLQPAPGAPGAAAGGAACHGGARGQTTSECLICVNMPCVFGPPWQRVKTGGRTLFALWDLFAH